MTTEIGPQKLYILESDRGFKNMDNTFKEIIRLKKSVGNTQCKKWLSIFEKGSNRNSKTENKNEI